MSYLRFFITMFLFIGFTINGYGAYPVPNSGSTAGMEAVRIYAQGLEDFGVPTGSVTIGGRNAMVTAWHPDSIDIMTPQGVGADQNIVVTTDLGGVIGGGLFYYHAPLIQVASPSLLNASGGQQITLTGSNFGNSQLGTPELRVNGNITSIAAVNHTTITFFMPAGTGTDIPIQYRIGGQVSNEIYVDYKPPLLIRLLPESACTEGGDTIILFGLHFGDGSNPPNVSIGGNPTASTWLSDHMILAVTPPYEPDFTEVIVTVGGQTSNTKSFQQNPPEIFQLTPQEWSANGGIPVTISGKNFSPLGSNTLKINGSTVTITNHGPSSLTITAPAGSGSSNVMEVTSGGLKSQPFLFDNATPELVSISQSGNSSLGGFTITLLGSNLGDASTSTVYINGSVATSVTFHNDNTIEFLAPMGNGQNIPVYVETGGLQSNTLSFSYTAPMLLSITGPFTNDENSLLQILNNFVSVTDGDVRVFINGQEMFDVNPAPTIMVLNNLPPGGGFGNELYAMVAGSQTNTLTFDYPAPVINNVNPVLVSPGDLLTVAGNAFGIDGAPIQASLGGTPMQVYGHTPTQLQLIVPPGTGTDLPLMVQVGNQQANPFNISYKSAGQSQEIQVLGNLKIENLGAVTGNTVLAVGPDGKVSRLRLPALKVSTIGDTLYLGNDQYVIVPGISDANR